MKVSIPFKRESVSKVTPDSDRVKSYLITFQFPSNGKAYPKHLSCFLISSECYVSIPFKRESVSKAQVLKCDIIHTTIRVSIPFKRESVSKAAWEATKGTAVTVSIPFKRESVSKEVSLQRANAAGPERFNSLQTGKRIQR